MAAGSRERHRLLADHRLLRIPVLRHLRTRRTPRDMVDQDIRQMTDELAALLQRKRDQYGTGNLAVFGEYGILVRVFDKVYRLRILHDKNKEPQDESIDD